MTAAPVTPLPAATVVVIRPSSDGIEVLLTHRPATMRFAGDMHVFPGGRVDAADASGDIVGRTVIGASEAAIRLGGDLDPRAAAAAHVAAIRELWEESGILLADTPAARDAVDAARAKLVAGAAEFTELAAALDLRLRTDLLVPLSRWVTPPGYPRRFDARFFAAVLPEDAAAASIASGEVVAVDWFRPAAALEAMAGGRLGMWLPTSSTLQQLEFVSGLADLDRLRAGPLGSVAVAEPAADVVRVDMPAAGGVSGQRVLAYLVGRRRFVLVDPGDPTGPALERCLAEVDRRGGTLEAIALSHVDPDHHAGAEGLAERLAIPVVGGPGAGRRLPYPIRELADGEIVDAGDVPLRALWTPGPRADHLAYVVGDGGAVLTGDLDGRRGDRMIPGPADEAAWAASRARLDVLRGRRLPGHPGARAGSATPNG